jgi:hypothetical protein
MGEVFQEVKSWHRHMNIRKLKVMVFCQFFLFYSISYRINLAAKLQLGKSLPSSYLAAKFFWLGILSTSSARSDCHVQTWLPSFEWLPSWNLVLICQVEKT